MDWILPIAGTHCCDSVFNFMYRYRRGTYFVKKNLDYVAKTLDGVEGQVQGITVKRLIYFIK